MRILFDATPETMYPLAKEGFSGGSQVYIKAIIKGLAAKGHQIHVIANDLDIDEQRGEQEFWWPPDYHPTKFDVVVQQMHLCEPRYEAPILVLMTSCVDPYLGPDNKWVGGIDAVPVFSEVHKKLLCKIRPVPEEKCFLTGLGVELMDYSGGWCSSAGWLPSKYTKVSSRMLYANDPARGLFNVLDIFGLVKKRVPEATLHVAYNFNQQFQYRAWEHSQMAQMLWDCKQRLESTPGVINLGALSREDIIREQLECQVHCMPSDPPGVGTQTHGITQMECAAAGCALVLSDIEAFPEVFGGAATILPVIGKWLGQVDRRITVHDYAEVVVELMKDPVKWREASQKARALAEQNTWQHVVDKWEEMLVKLAGELIHV